MNKVVKICMVAVALVCVFSLFVIPVCAIYNIHIYFNSQNFSVRGLSTYYDSSGVIHQFNMNTVKTWNTAGDLSIYVPDSVSVQPQFVLNDGVVSDSSSWDAGEIVSLSLDITSSTYITYVDTDISKYSLTLIDSSNQSLNFPASSVSFMGSGSSGYRGVTIKFLASQDVYAEFSIPNSIWAFSFPVGMKPNPDDNDGILSVRFGTLTVDSADSVDNSNTDKIVDAIVGIKDDILSSWTTDDNTSSNIDDFTGELQEEESKIFGDKSDEEALDQVNDVLDVGDLPDPNGTGSVHVMRFLNNTLDVLGTGFLSVLVMSLMIGLALTILGRSY